jgi:hypothetical protein
MTTSGGGCAEDEGEREAGALRMTREDALHLQFSASRMRKEEAEAAGSESTAFFSIATIRRICCTNGV